MTIKKVAWAAIVIVVIYFVWRLMSLDFLNRKTNIYNTNLSLITEPNEGVAPVLSLIEHARSSIDLVMYELEDKQVESALIAAEKRGVKVRVILSNGYEGQSFPQNEAAYNFLRASGVPVEWSPSYFALTHEKSLVIDGSQALIMTFNLTAQYYSTRRDFGILDDDKNDIAAIKATFNNDWDGNNIRASSGDDLVWSPGSEQAMVALIAGAKYSLDIYNEEMSDMNIVKALIDAAERGVSVNIDMTYSSEWKYEFAELETAGATVRTYDPDASIYIHAKMILVDGSRAFVGSENFSASSLDNNRELGIMVADPKIIASLAATFNQDRRGATPDK